MGNRKQLNAKGKSLTKPEKKAVNKIVDRKLEQALELKYIDLPIAVAQDYNWALYNLSVNVSQGTSDTTRNGDKLLMKNLELRWSLTGADTTNFYRIVVYIDKDGGSGTVPMITSGSVDAPTSLYNHDYRRQFRILSDRMYGMSAGGPNTHNGHTTISLKNIESSYTGATTTCIRNALYVAVVSDSAAGNPQLYMKTRMRFLG